MRNGLVFLGLLLAGACGGQPGQAQTGPAAGAPVDAGVANAPQQASAFPGQTRAPEQKLGVAFTLQTVAQGLEKPWGLAFLPDGRMLVTEKVGRLRIVSPDGALSAPVAGMPPVDPRDQGGLLDVALDPAFAENGLMYWSYAEPRDGGNGAATARGRLIDGPEPRVEGGQVIFRQTPTVDSTKHYGGRLVFARDGNLFITTGERSILEGRRQAQSMDGTLGKVVRIAPDGSVPADNPYRGQDGARPEIYSSGHRNILSAALHPSTGELWEVEHGARGGDELNVVRPGKDYGWPTITYGVEYSGATIGQGLTAKTGMEQPLYYWDPVIAPAGMAFYQGGLFPTWKDSLFIGGLKAKALIRLSLDGEKVTGEEHIAMPDRIRDVRQGPDGALYVLTDSADGKLLKLVPEG